MARTRSTVHNRPGRPIFRRSLLAMAIVGMTVSAQAQEADKTQQQEAVKEGVEIIEVKGTRANLQSAQNVKRLADTVVDGISAEDIGVLPDRSVLKQSKEYQAFRSNVLPVPMTQTILAWKVAALLSAV